MQNFNEIGKFEYLNPIITLIFIVVKIQKYALHVWKAGEILANIIIIFLRTIRIVVVFS